MMYVTRRATFSASHRLYNPDLSEEDNLAVYDKCANPRGHGHNYVLEVTVAGDVAAETGYVLDLKVLKQIVQSEIVARVDHKHLNEDVEFLRGVVPTTENLARAFWRILETKIPGAKLHSIRLRETENSSVEYKGE